MTGRRGFLKAIALATGGLPSLAEPAAPTSPKPQVISSIPYPRLFSGRQLSMLAFPLGGIGAGGLALGGRGQLRDWEIFNKAERGRSPSFVLPCIWVQTPEADAVARVLESRLQPPYEADAGLGPNNAPGLPRFAQTTFTGEYPLATIQFSDPDVPVQVKLEAFTPIIPLDAESSGLPVAVLRYRVTNRSTAPVKVAIAYAIDNPVEAEKDSERAGSHRTNTYRAEGDLKGVLMTNPGLAADAPMHGSFALAARNTGDADVTHLTGWHAAGWWTSALHFWDDFSADGRLGPEAEQHNAIGTICVQREIPARGTGDFEFLLAWHFPNRTPARMGWSASSGAGDTVIGNHYAQRFPDAWQAALYCSQHLETLETAMRQFLGAMRDTTLPSGIKEAAMSNLSTLATTTCFRTADGRFFGFEGSGCCHGNCTHVWNYEIATNHLFPSLARSMRETHLELSTRMNGAMAIRVDLPLGKQVSGPAAADGQMGQIIKAYLDWQLSGDDTWLRRWWPAIKKAMEFSWIENGWDGDRDGVLEGVQHNTYDVEFYGPNPMCGIYYLGALRAAAAMARAAGDSTCADEYLRLASAGSAWIDRELFNGEYYIQKVRPVTQEHIAKGLTAGAGAADPEHPDYQMGEGCLVDQLIGQYVAQCAGLGTLVDAGHIRKTLEAIYRYNYKRTLTTHNGLQRVFALNDEAALVICDYGKAKRPATPFPYFSEVMTGFEYSAAMLMLAYGMVKEGVECIENIRRRYDGERRNPWDESECGRHYARAMAAWTAIPLLSGFRYSGPEKRLSIHPVISGTPEGQMKSFWSTATGWGTFTHTPSSLIVEVLYGQLPLRAVETDIANAHAPVVQLGGQSIANTVRAVAGHLELTLNRALTLREGDTLHIS